MITKSRNHDLVITKWHARFLGRRFPCATGRGGIGPKAGEGDGVTPVGRLNLFWLAYNGKRIAPTLVARAGLAAHPIGPQDKWSDDPRDPNYNQLVRAAQYSFSHERLARPDPLYDLVGILDYNYPDAKAGAGSAIFLHVWRKARHPTEGCIAFCLADLKWILTRWREDSRVVIEG